MSDPCKYFLHELGKSSSLKNAITSRNKYVLKFSVKHYINDKYGWDFWANDNDPKDYNSHGTHVSGIIGAQGDNGTATVGVNWNVKIMALRIAGVTGSLGDAVEAITYAVDNGANIINASWGATNFSQTLYDAIGYANDHGVLLIAAAMNGGTDGIGDNNDWVPVYPSSFDLPNIISVAATDQDDNLTNYSNFGPVSVDVGAPGDNIYSTVPEISTGSRMVLYSEDFDPSPTGWISGGINSTWGYGYGTGIGGSNCLEDSPGGNYFNNTDSFAGFGFPFFVVKDNIYKLSFGINADLEENMDFLYLSYSLDGTIGIPYLITI